MSLQNLRQYANHKIFISLMAIILVALVGTLATFYAVTQLLQVRHSAQMANEIRFQYSNLLAKLDHAESAQRSYLLTGESQYLVAYQTTAQSIPGLVSDLEKDTAHYSYADSVKTLNILTTDWLAELAVGVQRYTDTSPEEAINTVRSGRSAQILENLHAQITSLEHHHGIILAAERSKIVEHASLARHISLAMLIVTLLLAFLVYYLFLRAIEGERELDRAKDEFVSLASHQLRTPATGIKSILSVLLAEDFGPLNERQRYFMNKAVQSNERELHIVEELLNVAKADAGRLVLQPSEVDLAILIDVIVAEQRRAIEEKHLKITVNYPDEPFSIIADEEKLYMTISNLLDNARKYTPDGGHITITTYPRRSTAIVEVVDTGEGIDEADIAHVFDRFQRARSMLSGKVDGTGLGLYLARRVAELHNGSIEVDSKKGRGSKFILTLPIRRS